MVLGYARSANWPDYCNTLVHLNAECTERGKKGRGGRERRMRCVTKRFSLIK